MVMIGTSAGGYAALLFGALAGCGAHAFVPQTFIDPALREQLGDGRWSARVEALGDALDSRYADLLPLLSESTAPADIYYGTGNRLDRVHAERLDGLPQVTLHPFETERHNVARELRDSGWLERFLFGLARGAL
jgi:hypothetical protein